MNYQIADLFCGAGGTSSGAIEAASHFGFSPRVTAVNHWDVAIATHTENHPESRHLCTGVDSINPRTLFREKELSLLWASPECTHHSIARGGKPINDQSRATAWCVVRWAEALLPPVILVENVPEFQTWGPIGSNGRPLKSQRGKTFKAWLEALRSLGYKVDYRLLRAADYGDPTTRTRLFVQAVRGRRRIVWPHATHSREPDMMTQRRWTPARDIIDWSLAGQSIYERKKPLSEKTMARIEAGLKKYGLSGSGEPYIVAWDHTSGSASSGVSPVSDPLSTVVTKARHGVAEPFLIEMRGTARVQLSNSHRSLDEPCGTITAGGRHHALIEPNLVPSDYLDANDVQFFETARALSEIEDEAFIEPHLLPQQSDGRLRPISEPVPTIATSGAVALVEPYLVSFYGNGQPHSIDQPAPTVTCKDRFGLVRPVVEMHGKRYQLDIRFRMLQPHELAAAQGFPRDYRFTGNKTEQVKQIGNAVPRRLARALVAAAISQDPDVSALCDAEEQNQPHPNT